MGRFTLLAVVAVLLPTALRAQTIVGHALDAGNRAPLVGASVVLVDQANGVQARTSTDAEGLFTLRALPPGSYRVRVESLGYETTESGSLALGEGAEPLPLEILLDPLPIELDPVTVNAEAPVSRNMEGFLRRRAAGFGRFIGPEDIERRNPFRVSDLLVSQTGFRRGGFTPQEIRVRSRSPSGGFCAPAVYVDGIRNHNAADYFDMEVPDVSLIRAIEIYQEAQQAPYQPPALGGEPQCAVIVIWTEMGMGR